MTTTDAENRLKGDDRVWLWNVNLAWELLDVPPFIRPLLLGKNPFA